MHSQTTASGMFKSESQMAHKHLESWHASHESSRAAAFVGASKSPWKHRGENCLGKPRTQSGATHRQVAREGGQDTKPGDSKEDIAAGSAWYEHTVCPITGEPAKNQRFPVGFALTPTKGEYPPKSLYELTIYEAPNMHHSLDGRGLRFDSIQIQLY